MAETPRHRFTLEIGNPVAVCSHCRFATELSGEWSVENGALVFRADPDPQPGRGPDLDGCVERGTAVEFERVNVGRRELGAGQVAQLRETSRRAQDGALGG